MTAIAALLDVTAKRGGAATLDRGHRMPLCGRQRRAVLVSKSRPEVAEHIRHFQPPACHLASGGYQVRHSWRYDGKRFQRTGGGADLVGGDHQIWSRGAEIPVTQ